MGSTRTARTAAVVALLLVGLVAAPSAAKKKDRAQVASAPPACPSWTDPVGDSGAGSGTVPVGDKDLDLVRTELSSDETTVAVRIQVVRLGAVGPNPSSGTGDQLTLQLTVDGVEAEATAKRDAASPHQAYLRIGGTPVEATATHDLPSSTVTITAPAARVAAVLGKPFAEATVVPRRTVSLTGAQGIGAVPYDESPAPAGTTLLGVCGPPATQPALVPTGMDPGMTRRLAATLHPLSPSYSELCPDGPLGQCRGTLRSGDRFYTLARGTSGLTVPFAEDKSDCRIGTQDPHVTRTGQTTACPYAFAWRGAPGRPVSAVTSDTTGFPTTVSAYTYFGLQENVGTPLGHLSPGRPSTEHFAGLPAEETDTYRPDIRTVEQLDVDLRAQLCLGRHANDVNYGRVAVYVLWYDPASGRSSELSINLLTYRNAPPETPTPLGEYFFEEQEWWHAQGGPTPNPARWVGHVDGALWGLVPPELALQRDATTDCSGSLSGAPVHVRIPLGNVLRRLVAEGLLAPERLAGRYIGAIVNGVETWGRARLESEVSGFTLWRRP